MIYNNYMAKTGIFGGAFDPLHNSHIAMAEKALSTGLDKIVFVPSGIPPHKHCNVSFEDRIKMLKRGLEGHECFELSTLEYELGGVNYACDVLPLLKEKYGEIAYIIGGDSLIDLNKWKDPQRVVKLAPLIVFPRADREEEFRKALAYWREKGADITVIDAMPEAISSTCVRYLINMDKTDDIPEAVADYIKQNGLYARFKGYAEKLKAEVLPKTYDHIARTCECALRLNFECRLGLDNDEVFLSAMLHDCAKLRSRQPHDRSKVPEDCFDSEVEHQFYGAVIAEDEYGIKDRNVIEAISCHCTGKPCMTTLDKLIFCADMLEDARDFEGVENLRKLIRKDFEKGFIACLKRSYDYLKKKGCYIYPLTQQAIDYYVGKQ